MKNCKIYVNGRSEEIQRKLFELGCNWLMNGDKFVNTNIPFLFVDNNGITCTDDMNDFSDYIHPEVTAEEILNMKVEHKFKPFDKVIARYSDELEWRCDFYSHKDGAKFVCVSSCWAQCIPYEGNEHLVGTSNSPQ